MPQVSMRMKKSRLNKKFPIFLIIYVSEAQAILGQIFTGKSYSLLGDR